MDGDNGASSPASYIRLVQHLIEKCICYNMNREECMETLEKHADIKPVITSTDPAEPELEEIPEPAQAEGDQPEPEQVWKELEKENREFFETYKKDRGEESSQKNPLDQPAAAKSSERTTATTEDSG